MSAFAEKTISKSVVKTIGILTSGGDAPGLNAAIRGVARTAINQYGIKVIGIEQGYRGLMQGLGHELTSSELSGILTRGGTILGTSREKPFKIGREAINAIKENYKKWNLDALVCIGGNGTNTTAYYLQEEGLNVIGLPKTIDNDIAETEMTFGFHTAVSVATEAIDRLHTTAHSHSRIMIIEVMGHKAGWLGLYAGIAGGGDVILIPEIPYKIAPIAEHVKRRKEAGHPFSIIVVAEGAGSAADIAKQIKDTIDLDPRVTVLGHIQRGGVPTGRDRVNATKMGYLAVDLLLRGKNNRIVCTNQGHFTDIDIDEGLAMQKSIQKMEVDVLAAMTGL